VDQSEFIASSPIGQKFEADPLPRPYTGSETHEATLRLSHQIPLSTSSPANGKSWRFGIFPSSRQRFAELRDLLPGVTEKVLTTAAPRTGTRRCPLAQIHSRFAAQSHLLAYQIRPRPHSPHGTDVRLEHQTPRHSAQSPLLPRLARRSARVVA